MRFNIKPKCYSSNSPSNVLIDVVENHFQIKNKKWEVNKNVCNEYICKRKNEII